VDVACPWKFNPNVSKMKILFLISSSQIAGAEKQFIKTFEQLNSIHDITLNVIGRDGPIREVLKQRGYCFFKSQGGALSDIASIVRSILSVKPDYIVTWLYKADVLGSIIGKAFGIKVAISARNTHWPKSKQYKLFILRIVAKYFATIVIANSKKAKLFHQSIGYPDSKFRIIPNFVEIPKSENRVFSNDKIILGLAARTVAGKGHINAIEALRRLRLNDSRFELKLIGFGLLSDESIVQKATFDNLPVTLEEGKANLDSWFAQIDIYLALSTMWDSDSNSSLEAIMRNIPVITSPIQAIEDIEEFMLKVNPHDSREVARAVRKLLNKSRPELIAELSDLKQKLLVNRNHKRLIESWVNALS
jgi:glycosyltransferase involved in cell wall biosynthesis